MNTPLRLILTLIAAAFAPQLAVQAQTPEPYTFTTFAGTPPGSVNGNGTVARFNAPSAVAVDNVGNTYVADSKNHTIRKITPAGDVSTFAGRVGNSGNADGAGSAARFNGPTGLAVDSAGNVYVGDTNNNRIRRISPAGEVSTLAAVSVPRGVALDSVGNVYVAASAGVQKITPGGVVSTFATVNVAGAVTVDSGGNVYVSSFLNNIIYKITPDGTVSTLAGLFGFAGSGAADGNGTAARFNQPWGVTVDNTGTVFVADTGNNTIRKITPAGDVTTLAGVAGVAGAGSSDGAGSGARFRSPRDLAIDGGGNLCVVDTGNNTIRKITPDAVVSTLAGLAGVGSADGTASVATFNSPSGLAVDVAGNVYVGDVANRIVRKITPAGGVSTLAGLAGSSGSTDGTGTAARFNAPRRVAVDSSGNVYVADLANHTIRKITGAGDVSTLAGLTSTPGSNDGIGSAARFNSPLGIGVDSADNVYVADSNNNTIRKITPAGEVSTFAGSPGSFGSLDGTGGSARFAIPSEVALDNSGNVYVAERGSGKIRKITPAAVVTTVGNSAAEGMAADGSGNVYIADLFTNTIRKMTPAGVITILGGGTGGIADGTGSAARFTAPSGLAVDSSGKVYVADTGNNAIRTGRLLPAVPTPIGSAIPVDTGSIDLTFGQVTQAGTTTVSPINPDYAGGLPSDYSLAGATLAFEISTTAIFQGPILISFQVSVDPAIFSQLRVLHNENGTLVDRTALDPAPNPITQTIYALVDSLSPFVIAKLTPTQTLTASIRSPINADGSSVFNVKRGVVPIKFTLADAGTPTCILPSATISLTRTAGGTTLGPINESVYSMAADIGSNFRVDSCQYIYNLAAGALGIGTYRVDIKIDNQVVGTGSFQLK